MAGNEEAFQKAMNQGHSAAWDSQWDKAAVWYRKALEEFPENPKALTSLGLSLIELQQFEEALVCYLKNSVVTPDDPIPVEKAAQIYERLGRLVEASRAGLQAADLFIKNREIEKALENWQRITRINPENMTAHSRLAMAYERLGQKPEAVAEYLAVAALLQHGGDPTKAGQAVTYALQLMPDSQEARQALKLLKTNQKLQRPVRSKGGTGPVLMSKVRQMDQVSSPQEEKGQDPVQEARQASLIDLAGELFEQVEESSETQSTRRGLGAIARGAGAGDEDQIERTKIILHLTQAVNAQTQGDEAQAAVELEKAVENGFSHPAADFDLGYLMVKAGRDDDALVFLHRAVKQAAFALASRLLLGDLLRKDGKLTEASIEFLEALKIADAMTVSEDQAEEVRQLYEPLVDLQARQRDEKALNGLCDNVRALLLRADWRSHLLKAREQLPPQPAGCAPLPLAEMMIEAESSRVVEALSTVRSLSARNMPRTAMEQAYLALDYAPTYLPLHVQIGELLIKDNNVTAATEKLSMAARAYTVRGETHQATRLLQRIAELNPLNLSVRNQLIEQLAANGQIEEAIQETVVLAEVYFHRLAELEMARKSYTAAVRLAQKSKDARTWTVKILHSMADIDMQRLDLRQALRVFEQIRTLQPDDEPSRYSLIDLNFRLMQENAALNELDSYLSFLESKGQRNAAIPFLNRLMADYPDRLELRKRLADTYIQLGMVQEAVIELDAVGDALVSAGKTAPAISVIQSIVNLNPPNVADYQMLLSKLRGSKPL